ncbi:MAG: BF3164 family lipoprotein [Mangrovibacterium sp.]
MKKLHPSLKPFVVFVVTGLIIVGCEPTNSVLNKNSMFFSRFPREDAVVFQNIYEYKEGIAGMLKLVDSTLIIFNVQPGANNLLNNYCLDSGILSTGYLGKGRGPGEAMGPRAIGVNGNSLWLQDITLKKVFTIDKRKAINTITPVHFNEYPLENHYYMIDFKDSLHFFGVGSINSDYKIQEIDLISGKVITEYGKIEETPRDMPLQLFKSVYQSFIFTKPTGDKIVLPYRYIDAIEIFDTETRSSIAIHGPEEYDIKYVALPNGMSRTDETRFAFVNGTVTNEYIYLAYSGRTRKSSNSHDGNYIYVYDWDGNPIRKLILNRYIQGLAVSKDDNILYTFDVNTGFLIQAQIN